MHHDEGHLVQCQYTNATTNCPSAGGATLSVNHKNVFTISNHGHCIINLTSEFTSRETILLIHKLIIFHPCFAWWSGARLKITRICAMLPSNSLHSVLNEMFPMTLTWCRSRSHRYSGHGSGGCWIGMVAVPGQLSSLG